MTLLPSYKSKHSSSVPSAPPFSPSFSSKACSRVLSVSKELFPNQYYSSENFRALKIQVCEYFENIFLTKEELKVLSLALDSFMSSCNNKDSFKNKILHFQKFLFTEFYLLNEQKKIQNLYSKDNHELNTHVKDIINMLFFADIHQDSLQIKSPKLFCHKTSTFSTIEKILKQKELNEEIDDSINPSCNVPDLQKMQDLSYLVGKNNSRITINEFLDLTNVVFTLDSISNKETIGSDLTVIKFKDGTQRLVETSDFIHLGSCNAKGFFHGFGIRRYKEDNRVLIGEFVSQNGFFFNSKNPLPRYGIIEYLGENKRTFVGLIDEMGMPKETYAF